MHVKLTSERASHNWAGEQDARPNDLSGSRENGLDDELNQRMLQKLTASLIEDIAPLLPTGVHHGETVAVEAFNRIWTRLVTRLKGKPWKSSDEAIAELRVKRFPGLLLNG